MMVEAEMHLFFLLLHLLAAVGLAATTGATVLLAALVVAAVRLLREHLALELQDKETMAA
jgi:Na+/H+-dicarboxylate symporter